MKNMIITPNARIRDQQKMSKVIVIEICERQSNLLQYQWYILVPTGFEYCCIKLDCYHTRALYCVKTKIKFL